MLSQRLAPAYPRGKVEIESANQNDSIVYDVAEFDSALVQIIQCNGASWPATLVLSVELSLDGAVFVAVPAGAVTFTAAGAKTVSTVGASFLRVRVSTFNGSVALMPIVSGNNDQ